MKLNNKAFAASTILYGVLTMFIIILMLILTTMKSSKDINQKLVEQTEHRLNDCVENEMALQQCLLTTTECIGVSKIYNSCIEENNSLQK